MKKLTKLFILVITLALTSQSFAQKVGIKAGLNLSTIDLKSIYITKGESYEITPGFHLGPTFEIPFSNVFSLETSLLASTKGFRYTLDGSNSVSNYSGKVVVNILYIDLPITPKVTIDLGKLNFYGLAGPYIGIGLIGNARRTYTEDGKTKTENDKVNWENKSDSQGLKRLDYGLVLGIGIELKSFQFGLNYNHGIANLTGSIDDKYALTNRVLALSFGYKFGKDNLQKN